MLFRSTFRNIQDQDLPRNLAYYGGISTYGYDNTVAVTTAIGANTNGSIYVPVGLYTTTITASSDGGSSTGGATYQTWPKLTANFYGQGQVASLALDGSQSKRGKFYSMVTMQPDLTNFALADNTKYFNGDWSRQNFSIEHYVTGLNTLGGYSTGIYYMPQTFPFALFMRNYSGWNSSTDYTVFGNPLTQRTSAVGMQLNVYQDNKGDCAALNVNVGISALAKPTITSGDAIYGFATCPAVSIMNGGATSYKDGTYLNPFEFDYTNLSGTTSYDVACIGWFHSMLRAGSSTSQSTFYSGTTTTVGYGNTWIGWLMDSSGTNVIGGSTVKFPVDAGISFKGLSGYRAAIDLTQAHRYNPGTSASIVLADSARIYLNGSYGAGKAFPDSTMNPGTAYIQCVSGQVGILSGGTSSAYINIDGTGVLAGLTLNGRATFTGGGGYAAVFGGHLAGLSDNAYTCGTAAGRWSAVWAVNGTIQTSDPSLKTDIEPVSDVLPIIKSLEPKTFKWIAGGRDEIEVEEDQLVHESEVSEGVVHDIQIVDGKPVAFDRIVKTETGVYDLMPVVDADGNPVMEFVPGKKGEPGQLQQKMHPVPRMIAKKVKVKKFVDRPGKRTHWGFLATEVRDAFAATGKDFAGYVQDEDGTHHLRPDQLIPVLWQAVRELTARLEELEAKK